MNCKRAKLEISLWVTDDLDGSSVTDLEDHLVICPDCKSYRQTLQESLSDLKSALPVVKMDMNDSIWPGLANVLPDYREMQKRKRFNGWMLATAFTVACAAMVTFSSKENFFGFSGDGTYELDGKIFTPARDQVDGYRGFRSDSDPETPGPIPRKSAKRQNIKQPANSHNATEENANPEELQDIADWD